MVFYVRKGYVYFNKINQPMAAGEEVNPDIEGKHILGQMHKLDTVSPNAPKKEPEIIGGKDESSVNTASEKQDGKPATAKK